MGASALLSGVSVIDVEPPPAVLACESDHERQDTGASRAGQGQEARPAVNEANPGVVTPAVQEGL